MQKTPHDPGTRKKAESARNMGPPHLIDPSKIYCSTKHDASRAFVELVVKKIAVLFVSHNGNWDETMRQLSAEQQQSIFMHCKITLQEKRLEISQIAAPHLEHFVQAHVPLHYFNALFNPSRKHENGLHHWQLQACYEEFPPESRVIGRIAKLLNSVCATLGPSSLEVAGKRLIEVVNGDIGRQIQTSLRVFRHEQEIFIGKSEEVPEMRFNLTAKNVAATDQASSSRHNIVSTMETCGDQRNSPPPLVAAVLDEDTNLAVDLGAGMEAKTGCIWINLLHASDLHYLQWLESRHLQSLESRRAVLLYAGLRTAKTTTTDVTTDVTTLVARPDIRHCLLPRKHSVPSLSVRFNIKVKDSLHPILVQCVAQCRVLLEKCQNFETLKHWIKFPLFQYPQWEEHFSITWGDKGELAIYIHHIGATPFMLGDCVAVITMTETHYSNDPSRKPLFSFL